MNKGNENIAEETQVLIVGGGLAGLSAALFLLEHGIQPILVERHRTTSIHPRARGFDVRTMELYRELHLAEAIREAGKALAPAWGIRNASSMRSYLEKKKPKKKKAASPMQLPGLDRLAAQSPEMGARCTQDLSEPVLLRAARERGADIRFYQELVSFSQDDSGVTAIIADRDSGQQSTIKAAYMIAADGAKSQIRTMLQATMTGQGVLGNLLNIYFEADLQKQVEGRAFSILSVREPGIRGMLTSINNSDRWVFHLSYDPGKGERPEDFTHERIAEILQQVTGYPDVRIHIISVLPWQPTIKAVTEMQHGRIFLAGDAAHIMPPYGGKGANTGVQDVHNLAWKLAFVLKKQAGNQLLGTYSAERQPIGMYNGEQSGKWADGYGLIKKVNLQVMAAFLSVMVTSLLKLNKLFPTLPMRKLGGLMGFPDMRYPLPGEQPGYRKVGRLTGEAGTRFPHLWVDHQTKMISTLDLLGQDFILFTGADNGGWKNFAATAAQQSGIPLRVYPIGAHADLKYKGSSLKKVLGITDSGAVLVRPDGFVSWRFTAFPGTSSDAFSQRLAEAVFKNAIGNRQSAVGNLLHR